MDVDLREEESPLWFASLVGDMDRGVHPERAYVVVETISRQAW